VVSGNVVTIVPGQAGAYALLCEIAFHKCLIKPAKIHAGFSTECRHCPKSWRKSFEVERKWVVLGVVSIFCKGKEVDFGDF